VQHNRSLDGLRAVAIAPVLAIHAGVPFARGGGIGVDIFFALSGYLITSLLLADLREHGHIRLRRFWIRRAARLVPALVLVVLAVLLLAALGIADPSSTQLEALAAVTYTTNWTRAFGLVHDGMLNHTWSLAIEEQYYLAWPLALTILTRWIPDPKRLAAAILCIACCLATWRAVLFLSGTGVDRLYNGLDTRADSLLIGSALAAASMSPSLSTSRLLRRCVWPAISALAIMAIAINCHAPVMYLAGYFIAPCAAAVLILAVTSDGCRWMGAALAFPPIAWLGKISYGLYLWHVPVFQTIRQMGFDGRVVATLGVAMSIGLAALSFYTLERYFLGLRKA
jgi:peptidoglycan/LPS O-acetylase OafA/YrhL